MVTRMIKHSLLKRSELLTKPPLILTENFWNIELILVIRSLFSHVIPAGSCPAPLCFNELASLWTRGQHTVMDVTTANWTIDPVTLETESNFTCTAVNLGGESESATVYIKVDDRPECGIIKKEVDGKLVLVCTAQANPAEVDFAWKIKNENETVEDNIEKKGMQSILTLETRVENFRTYLCYPNNSVGVTKKPCEVDVSGTVSWWGRLDRDVIMILIAILTGIILVIVIICIILCIVCRRKQAADKCTFLLIPHFFRVDHKVCHFVRQSCCGSVAIVHHFLPKAKWPFVRSRSCTNNNNNVPGGTSTPMTAAKWPMRPGVLVHVNTNHSLLSTGGVATPNGGNADSRSPNETQASRASRIRAMFGPDQSGSLPGVFHSKSGARDLATVTSSTVTRTTGRGRAASTTDASSRRTRTACTDTIGSRRALHRRRRPLRSTGATPVPIVRPPRIPTPLTLPPPTIPHTLPPEITKAYWHCWIMNTTFSVGVTD
ncbi:unnamed protein product [Nesidiocoris tenuis]|uniref:Ig-like domain-containing protein n=1 Tax=Nesidiocoris tenuis TaxID=355587 RepID=A0A6H5HAG0_9HEMI|nr:unnamed protein product [Nesidiocoris tenuis]